MNLTDQQLNDIETRAGAATPGPWGAYTFGGDSLIEIAADLEETGCGYRARREICRLEDEPMDNDPAHREWTAEEDWAQVQADAAYIAALSPEVARVLVAEVRRLRAAVAELAQAIRLTREYVGEELLPAVEGWSWYDALRRHAPHELEAADAPVAAERGVKHPEGHATPEKPSQGARDATTPA